MIAPDALTSQRNTTSDETMEQITAMKPMTLLKRMARCGTRLADSLVIPAGASPR
ncbi:hypothetical protein D9M71_452890 [compost metagenome]